MLRTETASEAAFRQEVASWVAAELPEELRDRTFRPPPAQARAWYRKLWERGWIAPHWPKSVGGMGATLAEQVILMEEFARIGAPDLPTQGLNQIGLLLMHFGNEAQKATHLPRILSGEVIWCQGYSEPGSGSDLASLRTKARRDGDELVVSGHKIWTTWGHNADWMYALVRTGSGKRDGITFVLLDMTSPGITCRPITTIAGDDEFCEVFLDEVRVPVENVVGEIDKGWQVATALLDHERVLLGSPGIALKALTRVRRIAAALGSSLDARQLDLMGRAEIEVEALTASYLDALEAMAAGGSGESASYLKILATETTQFVLDVAQDLLGDMASLKHSQRFGNKVVDFSELFLQSRRLTIYGGSNEIQRSLIASRALQLPRGA